MLRPLTAIALSLSPVVAHAAGGGGVTLDGVYQPRYGEGGAHDAPGTYGCVGGVGYAVFGKGFRLGGDGSYCRGSDGDVQTTYGGVQLGHWRSHGLFFWSAYAGLGGGVFVDGTTPGESAYKTAFGYVKPTLSAGVALGPTALEFGLYGMVPVNFIQDVGTGSARGVVTPSVGLQVSFLFGWFRNKKHEEPAYEPVPEVQPDPCVGPDYGPDCPQVRYDTVEEVEDGPLAIPWGEAPPPPQASGINFEASPTNLAEAATGDVTMSTGPVEAQSGPVGPVTATTGAISVGNVEVAPAAACPACPACPASPDVQVFNVCGSSNAVNVGGGSSSQQDKSKDSDEDKADEAPAEAPLAVPAQ